MKASLFGSKIGEWYQEHHRSLPWRNTTNPYKIWLSEIILQQTRVAQGLPYYRAFIKNYPTLQRLAEAPERDILRLWQGLGYYSRARNLHTCAKQVCTTHGGKFPKTFAELRKLKGIGDYTAAAVASIAFGESVAVVDGNVFRVLSRIFGIHDDVASTQGRKKFAELANRLVPANDPGTHNQAVMEFGALHCTPTAPKCGDCPFQRYCVAFREGLQAELPVKRRAPKAARRNFYYFVIRSGGRWLMHERTRRDIWAGLYDFPVHEGKANLRAGALAKVLEDAGGLRLTKDVSLNVMPVKKHVLSHQVIHAYFVEINLPARWRIPESSLFAGARLFTSAQVVKLPKSILISRYLQHRGVL